ncbi:thiamine diphosphokinase [Mesobacterium sp. TK19101]|uniref:Thiamine diphosphokinase n=1 Tax=Mesobacterium hydrothermale TaxID=3111907 RepID=A0ABU6HLD0_9RHOB|nr:thiamine diphosphokinase [Mesobacterium sp. TK19101]MEC3862253.1 thiamine diphosphokinase [Mesobacterium sp. TK19101]
MTDAIVSTDTPVFLVGGGTVDKQAFLSGLALCQTLVAADGGADTVLEFDHMPDAVIGDMDSLSLAARRMIPDHRIHQIAEQDSTDFEKCLATIDAPLILGVGFLGARADHMLAAMNALTCQTAKRCVLIGAEDVIFAAPPELALDLPDGCRVSLFPMTQVTGRSAGLHWPIDGITFSPCGRVGTSNRATGPVQLTFDMPGMAIILPRARLEQALQGLAQAPGWPPVP